VFENFRKTVLKTHNREPIHFYNSAFPRLDDGFKTYRRRVGSYYRPRRISHVGNKLRGGIATISKRYASANNKHVVGYNDSEESRYITYLDANSLYAQSEPLPVGNFRFLDEIEIEKFSFDSIAADARIGYIIECDLSYPDHLRDAHNDYPMASEHLTVTRDMLSDYAVSLLDPDRPWKPSKKLVPNLLNKKKYVAHYRNLQLRTKHGIMITKIHRILSFTQRAWLKPILEPISSRVSRGVLVRVWGCDIPP